LVQTHAEKHHSMTNATLHPCEVELQLPVRTYDIDYAGIVSNIVYIRWLEDLRTAMLDAYLPLQALLDRGTTPILLRTDIRYRRAIRLFDRPLGRMWVSDIGRVRWFIAAEITTDGTISATAHQELAVISLQTFRPLPLPPEVREMCAG
jgi:acyl-CoA thioester hydrolase